MQYYLRLEHVYDTSEASYLNILIVIPQRRSGFRLTFQFDTYRTEILGYD